MDLKSKLTEHFTLLEVFRSRTADALGVPNFPEGEDFLEEVLENARALALNVLEPVREIFGPVVVNSWFRSPAVNKIVGGSPTSQHLNGSAADVRFLEVPCRTVFLWLLDNKDIVLDQAILEKRESIWLHLSYNRLSKNRREFLVSPSTSVYLKKFKKDGPLL